MRVPANLRLTPPPTLLVSDSSPQPCLSATHSPNPANPDSPPPPNTAYLRFIPLTLLISNSFPNPANLRLFP